jgi:hypothetical protein
MRSPRQLAFYTAPGTPPIGDGMVVIEGDRDLIGAVG